MYTFFNIYREDTDHLPRQEIGKKDQMSIMTDNETLDFERIRRVLSVSYSISHDRHGYAHIKCFAHHVVWPVDSITS